MGITNQNPFTTVRKNIQYVLEHSPDVSDVSAVLRTWSDANLQWLDNPSADRQTWMRVETVAIEYEPFWSNGITRAIHRMRLVCALPIQRGLNQDEIEQLAYAIMRAMTPLTRDDQMQTAVATLESLSYRAGAIGLMDDDQPDRQDPAGNMAWSQVGDIEAVYHLPVSEMIEELDD